MTTAAFTKSETALARGRGTFEPIALSKNDDVRFEIDFCLNKRTARPSCEKCVASCPRGIVTLTDSGPTRTADCDACGVCAAACPTDAISVPAFAVTPRDGESATTLVCRRVQGAEASDHALPCFRGLGPAMLADLRLRSGSQSILLVDQGSCATCRDGGSDVDAPMLAVKEASRVFAALGVPTELHPRVERRQPAPGKTRRVGPNRRDFFGRLWRRNEFAPQPKRADDTHRLDRRRLRETAIYRALAARFGKALPAEFLPKAEVGPACAAHGLCQSLCPTAALARVATLGRIDLIFRAEACIVCGRCEAACPEQAFHLSPTGGADAPVTLATRRVAVCRSCDDEFVAGEDQTICPACEKTQILFAAVAGRDQVRRVDRNDSPSRSPSCPNS